MRNFQSIFAVSASKMSGANAKVDRNGKEPIYLTPLAGKYPEKRTVLSGTIAENMGIKEGESYLVKCEQTENHAEFGPQFRWTKLKELSFDEIVVVEQKLGAAVAVDVLSEVPVGSGTSTF